MKVKLEIDPTLAGDELQLFIKAKSLSKNVTEFMQYVESYSKSLEILPLNLQDEITLVKIKDIIALEIYKDQLTVQTMQGPYEIRERPYRLLEKLSADTFVQISKSVAINLDHLLSLEAGFSGNMTAFLTNHIKENVSRSYLGQLKNQLGL